MLCEGAGAIAQRRSSAVRCAAELGKTTTAVVFVEFNFGDFKVETGCRNALDPAER